MANTKTATVGFETKTCGRCGGSGRHSYNQMHGDVCYGCSGTKIVYTKRGKLARAAFAAKRMELCGQEVATLQPGQKFLTTAGKWATVVSVSTEGGSRWLDNATGAWVPYTEVTTKGGSMGYCHGTERVMVAKPELWPELIEFARTLAGATVTDPEMVTA